MIFGVNATRSAVVIAETRGAGGKFVVTAIRPVSVSSPLRGRSGRTVAKSHHPFRPQGQGRRFRHCPVEMLVGPVWFLSGSDSRERRWSNSRLFSAASASSRLRRKVSKRPSAVRRIKNGGIGLRNGSIPTANSGTGPRARPERLPSPSRLLESDHDSEIAHWDQGQATECSFLPPVSPARARCARPGISHRRVSATGLAAKKIFPNNPCYCRERCDSLPVCVR